MKRKMKDSDWRNKTIDKVVRPDSDGDITIYFTDGLCAELKSSATGFDAIIIEPDALCNFCGLSCWLVSPENGKEYEKSGLLNKTVSGGYFSTPGNGYGALDDCTSYTFSLCEFCLDHLFSQFKTPPKLHDYTGLYPFEKTESTEEWESAVKRVEQDEWRRGKEEFNKEFEKRNKARSKDLESNNALLKREEVLLNAVRWTEWLYLDGQLTGEEERSCLRCFNKESKGHTSTCPLQAILYHEDLKK